MFAENVGSDKTTFLSPSTFADASIAPVIGPNGVRGVSPGFSQDPNIPAFSYDPRKGNLLIDFQNFKPKPTYWVLDAVESPLMSSIIIPEPSQDFTRGVKSSKALVLFMTFVAVPVPEPAIGGMAVVSGAIAGAGLLRRRKEKEFDVTH